MENERKKWLESERMKKLFRKDNLLVLILVGILLFVIALPTKDSNEKSSGADEGRGDVLNPSGTGSGSGADTERTEETAVETTEEI